MPSSKGPYHGTREKLSNDPRKRGISPPQRAIQQYEEGERVHLKIDPSIPEGRFHPRFDGHTGTVVGEQGRAFKVRINDGGKDKTLVVRAAHLKRQQE
ncbi:50S ribosomal protein L21e [Halomarina salina]|uniref:Large ribosomal subunit protein eL21 n=1 Tax=Halomarina salina TaxID=1872699 RepID=A0ABD5RSB4_9EURY|nr:50S ribosomal protein L21e [Halomarina salina]